MNADLNKQHLQLLTERVSKLNKVSESFCLAKWLQSTTTLYNGFTHSCHHPTAHKINIEDIKDNPRGLHNTPVKIAARQDMLCGVQTKECDYCWNIENLGKDHFSDRHYKSAWGLGMWENFDKVVQSGTGDTIAPTYLEVAFENLCNFKCTYCSPDVSSRWMEEVDKHGGYTLPNGETHHDLKWMKQIGKFPIHHREQNPYIDAFWEWWPELYQTLDTFRITGGEPLLSKNTWKILDYVIENPRPDFKLGINTNLGIPRRLVEKLCAKINQLHGKIREIVIYTSAESVGEQCEYARFGMDWDLFTSNVDYLMLNTPPLVRIQFMTTVNLLSAPKFDWFIDYIGELRLAYGGRPNRRRVGFGVAYLRWPRHQMITLLDEEGRKQFATKMQRSIKKHHEDKHPDDNARMLLEEVDQINRLVNFMNSMPQDPQQLDAMVGVFSEMDARRGTDFLKTFPELQSVWDQGVEIRNARLAREERNAKLGEHGVAINLDEKIKADWQSMEQESNQ